MSALDVVEIVLGAILVIFTAYDIFQSVVMPRPAVGHIRFSADLGRIAWRGWRNVAVRVKRNTLREGALAAFGPLMVVVLLGLWAFLLILGFALMYNGLHAALHPQPDSLGQALFYSTGRMLAFTVDGIQPVSPSTALLTSLEAASGFGVFALVIQLLFSLFTAFQRRETSVIALDALAGAPPSGVQLLESCAKFNMPEQLAATFTAWQAWTADVLESHLAYPLLFYFRSSHDNEAWTNSLGAVLDAATLVVTTIESGPRGPAMLMHKIGTHFIEDVRRYFGVHDEVMAGVERAEFGEACVRLRKAGYRLRDEDEAWSEFMRVRGTYGAWFNRVSRNLAVPPAAWIGDRSYLPHRGAQPAPRRRTRRAAA
jgi:hypothetical protein